MPNPHRDVRRLTVLALLAALSLAACGQPAEEGVGRGTVLSVDADAGSVTIDHGDIPGLMKGMTMTFEVADPALLSGIEDGQEVEFRVRHEAGRFVIHELGAEL